MKVSRKECAAALQLVSESEESENEEDHENFYGPEHGPCSLPYHQRPKKARKHLNFDEQGNPVSCSDFSEEEGDEEPAWHARQEEAHDANVAVAEREYQRQPAASGETQPVTPPVRPAARNPPIPPLPPRAPRGSPSFLSSQVADHTAFRDTMACAMTSVAQSPLGRRRHLEEVAMSCASVDDFELLRVAADGQACTAHESSTMRHSVWRAAAAIKRSPARLRQPLVELATACASMEDFATLEYVATNGLFVTTINQLEAISSVIQGDANN
jgi:hypothetical protein